jgi:hypothetical protein
MFPVAGGPVNAVSTPAPVRDREKSDPSFRIPDPGLETPSRLACLR